MLRGESSGFGSAVYSTVPYLGGWDRIELNPGCYERRVVQHSTVQHCTADHGSLSYGPVNQVPGFFFLVVTREEKSAVRVCPALSGYCDAVVQYCAVRYGMLYDMRRYDIVGR